MRMSHSGEGRSPELKRVYQMWERVLSDRGSDLTTMRDTVEEFYRANFRLAEDVEVEAVFAPVPGLWITTPTGRSRSILYFHGGGYALGSSRAHAEMTSWIAPGCPSARVCARLPSRPGVPLSGRPGGCVAGLSLDGER